MERITYLLILLLNLALTLFYHPIIMGFLILIQVPLYRTYIFTILKTSWFSYIILITFLGGILILFIYIIRLLENDIISNEITNKKLIVLFFFFIFFTLILKIDNLKFFNDETTWIFFKLNPNIIFIFFIFRTSYIKISLFIILYLFFTIISILKIITAQKKFLLKF